MEVSHWYGLSCWLVVRLCGASAGYVWNGIVHQTRPQAVGGAMLLGSLAAVAHAVLPEFDAHRFALSVLLDTGCIQDSEGDALRAQADAPPVLAPYSHADTREYIFGLLQQVSPLRKISDEEYENIKSTNPVVISSRRCALLLVHAAKKRKNKKPGPRLCCDANHPQKECVLYPKSVGSS